MEVVERRIGNRSETGHGRLRGLVPEGQRGLQVFQKGKLYGVMWDGVVTCVAKFKRVEVLPKETGFFALGTYMMKNRYDFGKLVEVTTVIDRRGQDLRVMLYGVVSWVHGCFRGTEEGVHSIATMYWDPVGNAYYNTFPNFRTVAGVEIANTHEYHSENVPCCKLRYSTGRVSPRFQEHEMFYNQDIVIARDYLVVKGDKNHCYHICGYLADSIVVESDEGYGFQQFFPDGRKGEFYAARPKSMGKLLNWDCLDLRRVETED